MNQQEPSHEADYNRDKQWRRLDVLNRVQNACRAFVERAAIRNSICHRALPAKALGEVTGLTRNIRQITTDDSA